MIKNKFGVIILMLVMLLIFTSPVIANDLDNTTTNEVVANDLADDMESVVSSSEVYVSPNGNGSGQSSNDPTNLDNAMTNLKPNSVVNFLDGEYHSKEQVISSSNVTLKALNSSGVVISGNDENVIFRVGGNSVTLQGLTLTEGYSSAYGGLVYWYGNYGTIINCTFTDSYSNSGGAVFWENANAKVINCTFINNHGDYAGAFHLSGEDGLIANCTFISNYAPVSDGGAIHISGPRSRVSNCTFISNTASRDYGGAIYLSGDDGVIENNYFSKNSDKEGCSIAITGDAFLKNNTGTNLFISNRGLITSSISVVVLDNKTVYAEINETVPITAYVLDDCGNKIIGKNITFDLAGNKTSSACSNNGLYYTSYVLNSTSAYISASYSYGLNVISKGATIKELIASLVGENVVMYYKNGTKYIVEVVGIQNVTGYVDFEINGVNYTRKIINNTASLTLNLNPGNYTIIAKYDNLSTSNNITILPTIYSSDFSKYFKNSTQYQIKLLDGQGSPLANATVEININGVFYNRTTNSDGIATLNINLNPGNYTATATAPNGDKLSTNIEVLSVFCENKDLVKYFKNSSQYSIKLLDDSGNARSGVNVTFNINGIFYNRTTNSEGVATLNINLNPGKYIITAISPNGEKIANNIDVLSILCENKDLTKVYGDSSQYSVKVLNDTGDAKIGANVTFNINGVFYQRITNSTGFASLNINLNPGDYVITASHNGCNVVNNIHVLKPSV